MTIYVKLRLPLQEGPAPLSRDDVNMIEYLVSATGIEINQNPKVDYQDWIETVCLFHSAIRLGYETVLWDDDFEKPAAYIPGKKCPHVHLGLGSSRRLTDLGYVKTVVPDDLVNRYGELYSFIQNAGRRISVAHIPGGDLSPPLDPIGKRNFEGVALEWALRPFSGSDVLIKMVRPAKSMPLYPITVDDPDISAKNFSSDTYYYWAHMEGARNSLLVQDKINMGYETRFFVAGGKVACGAACIDAQTPMNNVGNGRLDPVFEDSRNSGCFIECEDTADILLAAADRIAAEIAAEEPRLSSYTMDLALDEEGYPLLIELNPFGNSGLYAIDTDRLVEAVVDAAQ